MITRISAFATILTRAALLVALLLPQTIPVRAAEPHTVAFLGVRFQNDNETYEPTSNAERARLATVEQIFKDKLTASGRFRFADIGPDLKAKIAAGRELGECSGCEVAYGKEAGSEWVAWIHVQKISNLILNMNIYIADVATAKLVFVKSADIRSNTDESWTRSIDYLLKNYLLPGSY